jgi:hypothetical protein
MVTQALTLAGYRPLGDKPEVPVRASITFYVSDQSRPAKRREAPGPS